MKRLYYSVSLPVIAVVSLISTLTAIAYLLGGSYILLNATDAKSDIRMKKIKNYVGSLKLDRIYTIEDTVLCLDNLISRRQSKTLHIAFIGDSLVRDQFTNFIKMIPDYDRTMSMSLPSWENVNLHEDRNVTNKLLNFRVSFRWRPLIAHDFLDEFKEWNFLNESQAPSVIFIGATVHHMVNENDDGRTFKQLLENELLPVLRDYVTAHPQGQLIWLIQPPSLDSHVALPKIVDVFPDIHFDIIHEYNEITKRVFKGTRIVIWDLFDSFVKEYVRGCVLTGYKREDPQKFFYCTNNHHPGFGVTFSFATHLIIKHVCD